MNNQSPQSVCILGRQPKLGIAELESLYGAEAVLPLGNNVALVSTSATNIPLSRLGGTMKVCQLLTFLPFTDWQSISGYLLDHITEYTDEIMEGKIRLGLSSYGIEGSLRAINASGLALKKAIKNTGRSVRVVPNKASELNTAQIIHNQLTGPTGIEIVAIRDKNRTALARTVNVQDIDAYAARDQARPKRDSRVGMLPPKLAQIIINLAVNNRGDRSWEIGVGKTNKETTTSSQTTGQLPPSSSQLPTLLDPFCGTGVLLQEALLMGYGVYGTDLDPRMVEYSQVNLKWLHDEFAHGGTVHDLQPGDATSYEWLMDKIDAVACETYLGRPFSSLPNAEILKEVIKDVTLIHKKFLQNLAQQTPPGFRACIAVPAWKIKRGFIRLPILDRLEELGYTRTSFVHTREEELIYHRPEQIVARELVVLTRK